MISASCPRSRKYSPIVQPEYAATYCMAADSEAEAATTMVYSIAPFASSARTMFLIVDAFWPIATYTQVMFWPRWLMIVSTATADLPVWRSPMISSRWPRPIGTIESMAFRPVCTGCATDWRAITPGATFSITSGFFALSGPLPSIGAPSALTTRPISAGPTGTSRMRPVHLTVSPSEMCSYSPRITAPTESRSRFSARPNVGVPSGVGLNSSISPAMASESPCTRTMPSVTEITVPWLRMSALAARPSIRLLISSLISAGLSCMTRSLSFGAATASGRQRDFHLFEACLDRGIQHFVAHHHADAADERRVFLHGEIELTAKPLLQNLSNGVQLRGGEREGAGHHRVRSTALGVLHLAELVGDFRQCREAAVVDHRAQEVLARLRQLHARDVAHDVEHLLLADLRVGRELQQLLVARHGGERIEKLRRRLDVDAARLVQGIRIRA